MTLYFTTPTGVGEFDSPPDNTAFETAQSSSPEADLWCSNKYAQAAGWKQSLAPVKMKPRGWIYGISRSDEL